MFRNKLCFSFDYLNNIHGYRKVPIEFGSSYAGDDYSQKIVRIHEYLRDFLTSEVCFLSLNF